MLFPTDRLANHGTTLRDDLSPARWFGSLYNQASLIAGLLVAALALFACGDSSSSGSNQTTCLPGTFCECDGPSDCPLGETCNAIGVCVAELDDNTDAGTDDAATDVDIPDSDGGDPTDTDVDVDTDTDSDTGDADVTDAVDDTDVGDTDTDPDVRPDTTDDADVPDDTIVDPPTRGNPWIAYIISEQLRFMRADGSDDMIFEDPDTAFVFGAAWNPDGTRLAVLGVNEDFEGGLFLLDFVTGDLQRITVTFEGTSGTPLSDVAWSPDGTRIALSFRPPSGTSGIYEVQLSDVPASGDATVDATLVTTSGAGDAGPVYGRSTGDLYFIRTAGGGASIFRRASASGTSLSVFAQTNVLGRFSVDPTETTLIYQASGSGAVGNLRRVTISTGGGTNFGQPGDAEPSHFPIGDDRVALARNFNVSGSPTVDMVLTDGDGTQEAQLTETGVLLGPSFIRVAPVDNEDVVPTW